MIGDRPIDPATAWLLRAFLPGEAGTLRSVATRPTRAGDRLSIVYDLPDAAAMTRARQLRRSARSLRLVAIGRTVVGDLTAVVTRNHRTLNVDALLCGASEGNADG